MFYEVIPEGKVEALTYDSDDSLLPGQIVLVPIGKRKVPGVVVKKVAQPDFATKKVLKVLYSQPLPKHLMKVAGFIHDYYLAPTGQAISLILPNGVEKQRRRPKTEQMFGKANETEQTQDPPTIRLNEAQKNALQGLQKAPRATKLLFGVTGSGKTNIYVKMASQALSGQKSVILLVPEIALTGQLVRVFKEYFGEKIVLIHSRQTEVERHLVFENVLAADGPLIVIGPRSALFAPVKELGLIIIDEAHESTYIQENAPRYSAIRVASFMAKTAGCSLVLGSATPTASDYYIAEKQGAVVQLTEKAKHAAIKPKIRVIDFKDRDSFTKNKYFSDALIKAMSDNLEAKRQTLIFHNRRGSAPLTICENCGEEILCPNCYLPLTLHADSYELVCHTCGFLRKVPAVCPKCGAPGLVHKGFGTKLLESELNKLFPNARIRRFDADNKKGEGLEAIYDEVLSGEVDILVGTQTVAKGLDLPRLATVGVVQADAGLNLPDFMAEERVFQLLTQVMGRVGRGHLETAEVFIQTFRPEHPVLEFAQNEDYLGFYKYLIERRRRSGFPPFRFVAKIEITMKTEAIVVRKIRDLARQLSKNAGLIVSPPQPAFHERTNRGYTWQIIARSKSRKSLLEACSGLDSTVKVTFDPPGLL
ncbi:primosomal protein N' [Candidatus Saccharibacteria bacterium]|nr:primosomal protein N' [Candidatus Saccharibacteria bacterium]